MITDDPNHPDVKRGHADEERVPMNKAYLVLSQEERDKGFVRPVRTSYVHVGETPEWPLRDLTDVEKERYGETEYVKFEPYPQPNPRGTSAIGRFWTQKQLDTKGCNSVTTMGRALAETYAREPGFYGSTYCVSCMKHRPVAEFVWEGTKDRVGS